MAVKINVGDIIDTSAAKFGTRKDGSSWGFVSVNAEKGYDKITAWFVNPEAAQGRARVEVAQISGAKIGNRKYTDKSGAEKWATDYSVDITVKAAGAQQVPPQQQKAPNFDAYMGNSFMDLSQVDDPGLPFA